MKDKEIDHNLTAMDVYKLIFRLLDLSGATLGSANTHYLSQELDNHDYNINI